MSSRIEQVIDEIELFISECKYQTFSTTNIIVDKDRMDELLRDLRLRTPEEIKKYQKIISNKERILQDARDKADAMLNMAQAETVRMVDENEIMQQAYAQAGEVVKQATAQAQQIVDMATAEANNVRQSAMEYTFGQLSTLQSIIEHAIGTADAKYGDLIAKLRECDNIIAQDRSQLYPQVELDNDIAALEGYPTDQGKGGNNADGGGKGVNVI